MSDTKTDEPVFPKILACGDKAISEGGMTIRDYFAGQALAGLALLIQEYQADELASDAYFLADAMMKIRERNKPNH